MTHVLLKLTLLSQVPLGRLARQKRLLELLLSSLVKSYVTGTTLHVNGGMYMA